jgi:protein SSD1
MLNLPLYTHLQTRHVATPTLLFTVNSRLYSHGSIDFTEDTEILAKTAEQCNAKKDSAQSAQEQSVHIESCRIMDKKRNDLEGT